MQFDHSDPDRELRTCTKYYSRTVWGGIKVKSRLSKPYLRYVTLAVLEILRIYSVATLTNDGCCRRGFIRRGLEHAVVPALAASGCSRYSQRA